MLALSGLERNDTRAPSQLQNKVWAPKTISKTQKGERLSRNKTNQYVNQSSWYYQLSPWLVLVQLVSPTLSVAGLRPAGISNSVRGCSASSWYLQLCPWLVCIQLVSPTLSVAVLRPAGISKSVRGCSASSWYLQLCPCLVCAWLLNLCRCRWRRVLFCTSGDGRSASSRRVFIVATFLGPRPRIIRPCIITVTIVAANGGGGRPGMSRSKGEEGKGGVY